MPTLSGICFADEPQVAKAVEEAKQVARSGPFQPNWESLEHYVIPEWYRDAKFGMFIQLLPNGSNLRRSIQWRLT